MVRKIIFILFSFLLLFHSPINAVSYPQGNFVLAGGKFRQTDEFDPFEKIDKMFFSSIIIPVKDGLIDYTTVRPIDLESGKQHFKGEINFLFKGTYDKETGVINANFTQKMDNSYERKTGYGIRYGSGESTFSGKAKGTIIDNQVVLSFDGKLSSKSSSETDSKKVETYSNTQTWFKKVAFGISDWVESEETPIATDETERVDSGTRASDLSGQVEIACPPDLEAWDVMKMGRIIYVDCHLKTGEDSSATISFSDMTTFEMRAESEIVIDTPPEKDSKWSLIAGNIWVNVKKMIKDGTMEGHMSQAVAGIKGTKFVMSENGKESKLEVTEGKVEFTHNKTNEKIFVLPGESVVASEKGFSPKTKTDESKRFPNQSQYILFIICAVVLILLIVKVVLKKRKN